MNAGKWFKTWSIKPTGLALCALAFGAALVLCLGWLAFFGGGQAQAAELCVKPGGGDGCYPQITDALASAMEGDTILVATGIYTENVVLSQTVTLQGGWNLDFSIRHLEVFSSTIVPDNPSYSVVAILGDSGDPAAVAPILDGFVIRGGRAELGGNHGGGLRIIDSHALVISNTIRGNSAFFLGGGIWVQRGAPQLAGNRVEDNLSVGPGNNNAYGGGIQLENARARLMDNLISGNVVSGTQAYGGGLDVVGSVVTLVGNQVFSNTARGDTRGVGGGISIQSNAVISLSKDLVYANNAWGDGGGLWNDGQMLLDSITIQANIADSDLDGSGDGGGIYNSETLTISKVLIAGNRAIGGGGVLSAGSQSFTWVLSSTLRDNISGPGGGGGIINNGSLRLSASSILNNWTLSTMGVGGGLLNNGQAELINSTFSQNLAGASGGGISNANLVNLTHVTLISNTASLGSGGLHNLSSAILVNTLLADNLPVNCSQVVFSLGHNLEDTDTCGMGSAGDQTSTDPRMGSLGDFGGTSPTYSLMADSPAIDNADIASCPNTDQRGVTRPQDGDGDSTPMCDIGAYEYDLTQKIYLPVILK